MLLINIMANKQTQLHPRLYQLDTLITDLYEMVYSNSDDFIPVFLDITNLKMEQFKMPNYDLDVIFSDVNYIKTVPSGLLDKDGNSVNVLYFKRIGTHKNSTIEIIEYSDKYVANDLNNPINVNKVIRKLLSELVISKKTKNILLPIINVDATGLELSKYESLKSLVDTTKLYSINITEHFYGLWTLDDFLNKKKDPPIDEVVLENTIFWMVDLIYKINLVYPKFKCNNLIPKMINCYLCTDKGIITPIIKLGNFYLSEIGDIIKNNYLTDNNLPQMGDNYAYNDIYQFLNSLWNDHQQIIEKYPNIINIFDSFLPKKIRSKNSIYLSKEKWDSLSDDEQIFLNVRNIRSKLIEIYENPSEHILEESRINNNEVDESDINVDDLDNSIDDDLDNSINDYTEIKVTEDVNEPLENIMSDDVLIDSDSESESFEDSESIIKSNNIDIANMSKKNKDQSRIINVDDSDVNLSYNKKHKIYHGTRNLSQPSYNHQQPSRIANPTYNMYDNQPKFNPNSYQMRDNQPNFNSIGNFLGSNPNDAKMPNYTYDQQLKYPPQIPQQQIPQQQMPQQQIPQQMPQMDQNEMLQRYMASINNQPQMEQPQAQQQYDPNVLAMMQQQMMQQQQTGGYSKNPFFFSTTTAK